VAVLFELVYVIPFIHVNVLQADTTSLDTEGWLMVRFKVIVESQPAALGITYVAMLLEFV
jgi:nitrogen fixation/metabolism regulation signal transduction histidine kinase